jgi:hypothetical protein
MRTDKKITMLASSLDRQTKIAGLKRGVMKVLADEGATPSGLKVFKHGDGAQFAYEMYKEYVSDGNFQFFPDFMQKLDQMVFEFRGNQPLELIDDPDDDDDDGGSSRRSKGKKKYKPVKKRPRAVTPIPSDDGTANVDVDDDSVVVSSIIERIKRRAK